MYYKIQTPDLEKLFSKYNKINLSISIEDLRNFKDDFFQKYQPTFGKTVNYGKEGYIKKTIKEVIKKQKKINPKKDFSSLESIAEILVNDFFEIGVKKDTWYSRIRSAFKNFIIHFTSMKD